MFLGAAADGSPALGEVIVLRAYVHTASNYS